MKRTITAVLIALAALLALGGAARADEVTRVPAERLAEAIAAAAPGDTIEVTGGTFNGNLVVTRR